MFRDPRDGASPKYTVYPLAGTRTIGNFQSSAPPPFISDAIVEINKVIREEDNLTPLRGGASQGYHEAKASFRHGVHLQAIAKGHVTAWAAAQAGFLTLASPTSQDKIKRQVEEKTPWSVFVDQLNDLHASSNRGVRFETNYEINKLDMKSRYWTAK